MKPNPQTHICGTCGSSNIGSVTKGSTGLEVALWIIGILTCGTLLIVAIPYSIWRLCSRFNGCRDCHGQIMIPRNSPAGRQLQIDMGRS